MGKGAKTAVLLIIGIAIISWYAFE